MIKVRVFGSGSSGNCYCLDNGTSQLLLEAGVKFSRVQKMMGFSFKRVDGLLITHEHTDHSKYLKDFEKRTNVYFYTSPGTLVALDKSNYRYHPLEKFKSRKIGDWKVTPFPVEHDAADPVGYLIETNADDRLLYVTDTYYVRYCFKNITQMLVEMNYSLEIANNNQQQGRLMKSLENRIFKSHFEESNSLAFIKANMSPSLQWVELIHLSDANSDEREFKRKVQELTGVPVYVAPRDGDKR